MSKDWECQTCGLWGEFVFGDMDEKHTHCDRCGTYCSWSWISDEPSVFVPQLVDRCRKFDVFVRATAGGQSVEHWNGMGISECLKKQ